MRHLNSLAAALIVSICAAIAPVQAQNAPAAVDIGTTKPQNTSIPKGISKDEADTLVWKLPEVKAWDKYLKRVTHDEVQGSTSESDAPELLRNGKYYWMVQAEESHPDHMANWTWFMVRIDGKEILIYDLPHEEYLSLKRWRAQKPLKGMGG